MFLELFIDRFFEETFVIFVSKQSLELGRISTNLTSFICHWNFDSKIWRKNLYLEILNSNAIKKKNFLSGLLTNKMLNFAQEWYVIPYEPEYSFSNKQKNRQIYVQVYNMTSFWGELNGGSFSARIFFKQPAKNRQI